MANIVLGMGTSHTPMLLASDETLPRFLETDQIIKLHDKEGRPATYGELLENADPRMAGMVAPADLVKRQNRARAATRRLREVLESTALDALIVFGDDQNESYLEDCRPAFAVYFGETIRNNTKQHETYSHLPEWYIQNRSSFFEPMDPRDYPVHAGLAAHLINYLMDADFDLAASKCLRSGEGEGHAVAYIHRHIMNPRNPVPAVPFFINTYYPPSQPRPGRCYRLGQAVRLAVESYPTKARVGVVASGGLSHFVVDEEFDRRILEALRCKEADFLQHLPRNKLMGGSSEILNWVALAGTVEHLEVDWFEYVPGYRTPAGTGTGMSFAVWK